MSKEQKEYIKKYKINKYLIFITQIFILISIILLWQILSDKNIINSFITSSPKKIINTIYNLYIDNNLFNHIYITLKETIISFVLTSIISFIIAIILYSNKFLQKVFDPYLIVLSSLPKVALGPLLIIWLGANQKSIITMAILISIIVSIQNILDGFNKTDKSKIKLLKTFNASKLNILFYLIIPQSKETIINTLKINLSLCLVGVIMGEFLTSKEGLGHLILYGMQIFNLDIVMSGITLLLIISIGLYKLIKK